MGNWTRAATALVLTAIMLAGCVSDPAGVHGSALTPANSMRPAASVTVSPSDAAAETGSIEGAVMDQELRPIPNATVSISGLHIQAVTGPDGAFAFHRVSPGTHVLEAFAGGFEPRAKQAQVKAGEPIRLEFVLQVLPLEKDPHVLAFPRDFLIGASAWADGLIWTFTEPRGVNRTILCKECVSVIQFEKRPSAVMFEGLAKSPAVAPYVNERVSASLRWCYKCSGTVGWSSSSFSLGHYENATVGDLSVADMGRDNTTYALLNVSAQLVAFQYRFQIWSSFAYLGSFPAGYTALPPRD